MKALVQCNLVQSPWGWMEPVFLPWPGWPDDLAPQIIPKRQDYQFKLELSVAHLLILFLINITVMFYVMGHWEDVVAHWEDVMGHWEDVVAHWEDVVARCEDMVVHREDMVAR